MMFIKNTRVVFFSLFLHLLLIVTPLNVKANGNTQTNLQGFVSWEADHNERLDQVIETYHQSLETIEMRSDKKSDRQSEISMVQRDFEKDLACTLSEISKKVFENKEPDFLKDRVGDEQRLKTEIGIAFKNWLALRMKRAESNISHLPLDLLKEITKKLRFEDAESFSCSSRYISRIGKDQGLGKYLLPQESKTKSGVTYIQITKHPILGKAWRDLSGLAWPEQPFKIDAKTKVGWKEAQQYCLNFNPPEKRSGVQAKFEEREVLLKKLRIEAARYRIGSSVREKIESNLRAESKKFGGIHGCYLPNQEELDQFRRDMSFAYDNSQYSLEFLKEMDLEWSGSFEPSFTHMPLVFRGKDGAFIHTSSGDFPNIGFRCVCGP